MDGWQALIRIITVSGNVLLLRTRLLILFCTETSRLRSEIKPLPGGKASLIRWSVRRMISQPSY